MDLCEGMDLERHVQASGGPVDITTCKSTTAQLLRVLQMIHADNVIHRDIKSANVMNHSDAGGSSRITVVDLGVCYALQEGMTLKKCDWTEQAIAQAVRQQRQLTTPS